MAAALPSQSDLALIAIMILILRLRLRHAALALHFWDPSRPLSLVVKSSFQLAA
jgi:hypothetical protein